MKKNNKEISEIGYLLADNFSTIPPLSKFVTSVGIKINIPENEAFFIVLALSGFSLSNALHSEKFNGLLTADMKYKMVESFLAKSLMINEYFKCDVKHLDFYYKKLKNISDKYYEIINTYKSANPDPYWFLSKHIYSLLSPNAKAEDAIVVMKMSEYSIYSAIEYVELLLEISKHYKFVKTV